MPAGVCYITATTAGVQGVAAAVVASSAAAAAGAERAASPELQQRRIRLAYPAGRARAVQGGTGAVTGVLHCRDVLAHSGWRLGPAVAPRRGCCVLDPDALDGTGGRQGGHGRSLVRKGSRVVGGQVCRAAGVNAVGWLVAGWDSWTECMLCRPASS